LGVDPKKCDRKRIRNRKLCHSKLNQTAKYHNDQLTHKQQAKSSQPCFSRFAKKVNKNSLSEISETNTLKKISSTLTDDNFTEFLDKGTTDELNEIQYEKCPIQTMIKEDIFKKKLDTIIVSTGELIAEPQSLNCFISHRIDSTNTVRLILTVKKSQVILDSRAQKTTPKRPTPSERFEIFVNKVKRYVS